MKIEARPWRPQDLLDDLQDIIDEEPDNYLNTRRTTLEMALAYLKEHFAETKWIPVSERLPEESGEYLAYCGEYDGICVLNFVILKTKSKWKTKWKKVTHWMPLPEPPKEEQK